MNDRERFNNQMHYKLIDRCFNMEFGYWGENFMISKSLIRTIQHEEQVGYVQKTFGQEIAEIFATAAADALSEMIIHTFETVDVLQ